MNKKKTTINKNLPQRQDTTEKKADRYFSLWCLVSVVFFLSSCSTRKGEELSLVSMQLIDRNGFSETISSKDRLATYEKMDFSTPQPYQKVLQVYRKEGKNTSKVISYHPNGQLWQRLEAVSGRAHGLYQEWHSNGVQKLELHVIEGMADITEVAQASWIFDGKNSVWDEKGHIQAEIFYEKGMLHTPSLYYYPNGQLQKIVPYSSGKINGAVELFDEKGVLTETIFYEKDLKQGVSKGFFPLYVETYDKGLLLEASYYNFQEELVSEIKNGSGRQATFEEGKLHMFIEYRQGIAEGLVEIFSTDGLLLNAYTIKEGKKEGEEWEYYPVQKKPKLLLSWHQDILQGTVKTWYLSGGIESQKEMRGNKKEGLSFAWYENGDLMLMEEYAADSLVKGSYYKQGDKKAVSLIEAGKGLATLYDGQGRFQKKISYEKGKPID